MAYNKKSYGWLGVDMPRDVKLRMALLQRMIKKEDLYDEPGFGVDKNPHVTIAYGHQERDPSSTRAAIKDLVAGQGRLGRLSTFDNKDYKVLKFEVDSDSLHDLNARIKERIKLPGNTYPEYKPHVTVAYLKPDVDIEQYRKLERLLRHKSFPVKMLRWGSPDDRYHTLLLKDVLEKSAAADEGLTAWIKRLEGSIPLARRITNAAGVQEPHQTVGTGHYLSPANEPKLRKLWGDRYAAIKAGSPILDKEDSLATEHHLSNVVPGQLDKWNPRWWQLNPMMQAWLKTHAYSLGNNISKFKQGSNAVNAMAVNPNQANADRLWRAFWDSKFKKQTGERMNKARPLFEAGKRIALKKEGAEKIFLRWALEEARHGRT